MGEHELVNFSMYPVTKAIRATTIRLAITPQNFSNHRLVVLDQSVSALGSPHAASYEARTIRELSLNRCQLVHLNGRRDGENGQANAA